MLTYKSRLILLLSLTLLILTACATNEPPPNPTPTIVALDRSNLATATGVAVTPPTRTPIPFPSPTPTSTPFSFETAAAPPTPTSTTGDESNVAKIEIIATGVYLRAGPGTAYQVSGGGRKGDQFEVIGLNPGGQWFQIITKAGDRAWISASPDYTRLIVGKLADVPLVGEVSPAPPTTPAATPSSSEPGSSADLSGRLVFATSSGGALYLSNADGSGLRYLADGVIDPVVSPDGQEVAFTRWDGAEVGTLYTLNLDDGRERVIMGDTLQAKSPTWSPDGTKIVLSFQYGGLRNPEEECREFDADDTVRIPLRARVTSFQITKNGIEVCFIRWEDLQWGLRRVEVETGQFENLPVDRYSYNPAWDPQNDWRVIYDGDKGLMQLDVTANNLWPITTDVRDSGPVFSPDGQQLALTYQQHDHWEVYTLALSGGNARQRLTKPPLLADPQYSSAAPAWSPDGRHLAFFTDRSGVWQIWVMNADGSNPRPMFDPQQQAQLDLEYHGVNERLLNWIE